MTKKKAKDGVEEVERILMVRLTRDEIAERATELVATLSAIDEAEAAKRAESDRRKKIIDDLTESSWKLRQAVRNGAEERSVLCRVERDFKAKVVRIIRHDTDDVVFTRGMTAEETQGDLKGVPAPPPVPPEGQAAPPPPAPMTIINLVQTSLPVPERLVAEEGDKPLTITDEKAAQDVFNVLCSRAIDVLRETQRASVTTIMRRLTIRNEMAHRIMDELERRKIVGGSNGEAPREILALPEPEDAT